jgi:IS5 family transposase
VKESDETDQPEEKQSAKELRAAGKPDRKEKKKAMEHERNSANTGRSNDGTSSTKNHDHHFGYKAHTLVNEIRLIEKLSVTAANIHDSQIDLSIPGIVCYRDRGYFRSECRGINGTMDRSVRDHPLPMKIIRRNLRISRIRSVEHPYAFMKRMFGFAHTMVTSVQSVRVKTYFTAICYTIILDAI